MSEVLSYTIQHVLWHISVPLNTGSDKILFSNHFERCPEEILKLDGKVSISQALTTFLSASCISQLEEKNQVFFNHVFILESRPDF